MPLLLAMILGREATGAPSIEIPRFLGAPWAVLLRGVSWAMFPGRLGGILGRLLGLEGPLGQSRDVWKPEKR